MQKFNKNFNQLKDIEVETPNKEEIIKAYNLINDKLIKSTDENETIKLVKKYFELNDTAESIFDLISIHHTMDTSNEKYDKLNDLSDEILPEIYEADNKVQETLLHHMYRKVLEKEFGTLFFRQIELSYKTFSKEIIPDLVEENKLVSEYNKLVSSALIEYKGEKYSLSQMGKFKSSNNRDERKEASELYWKFYSDNDEKIGQIYDMLVKVRTRIAHKLGYKNFVQLGYDRLRRLDWNSDDAKEYREKIYKYFVPICKRIVKDQETRLNFKDGMKDYDTSIFYKSGNPKPIGNINDLIPAAKKMYTQMHKYTAKYFSFMVEHGCLDLEARPNKSGGGYMQYIPALHTSFIFANANGTSADVDVLTHEFGHSLQGFLGGQQKVPTYRMPGYETCEIHSMSMEFLTYPWMDYFFGDQTEKYKYKHISNSITFLPYGAIVDDFQTYVYENPDLSHKQRKAYWRKIEKKYVAQSKFDHLPFFTSGGYWMVQRHIFESPFYYLDYTIAQVVALQFLMDSQKSESKWKKAFKKYINLDLLAGTKTFRELLLEAKINNPLDGDNLKKVALSINRTLKKFDPVKLDK